jgi:hypothetical protein
LRRAVSADQVRGAKVVSLSGEACGYVQDLSLEKRSGRIVYALVGESGWLGLRQGLRPVPWSLLRYDAGQGAYVVPVEKPDMLGGPSLASAELRRLGADDTWQDWLARSYPYPGIPFF